MNNNDKEPERIGFGKKFTKQTLERLVKQRDELLKRYSVLRAKQDPVETESIEMEGVRRHREAIDTKILEVRDWYGIRVLEGVEEESRRLKRLTIVLIALTTTLAIFTGLLVFGIRLP